MPKASGNARKIAKITSSKGSPRKTSTTTVAGRRTHPRCESRPKASTTPSTEASTRAYAAAVRVLRSPSASRS